MKNFGSNKDIDHSPKLSSRDVSSFDLAIKVAGNSECRYAHGAVIRRGKTILSVACNKLKTHPVQRRYSSHVCSVHAEIRSIILAKGDVTGAVCYSARVKPGGVWAISKPCDTCWQLLIEAGIKEVVYYDGKHIRKERVN